MIRALLLAIALVVHPFESCTEHQAFRQPQSRPHLLNVEFENPEWFAVWASSDRVSLTVGAGGSIARSEDDGRSWSMVSSHVDKDLHAVFSDPTSAAVIAVGDEGVIVRSEDRGRSWSTVSSGIAQDLSAVIANPGGKALIAVGDEGVIVRSEDGGRSWSVVKSPGGEALEALAVDPASKSLIAVGDKGVIVRSEDGGRSWSVVRSPGGEEMLTAVTVDPASKSLIAFGTRRVNVRSEDGGRSWSKVPIFSDWYLSSVIVDPASNSLIAVGDAGEIVRSDDGGRSWSLISILTGQWFNGITVDPTTNSLIGVGQAAVIARSEDDGWTWSTVSSQVDQDLRTILSDPTSAALIAFRERGGILRSQDGGSSWSAVLSGSDNLLAGIADPASKALLAIGRWCAVARSEDGGRSWSVVSCPFGPARYALRAIVADPTSEALILVGQRGVIARSEDGGRTWSAVSSGVGDDLDAVIADPTSKALVAVGANGVITRSADGGRSWLAVSSAVKDDLEAVVADPTSSALLAVGGEGAVTRSQDGGRNWSSIQPIGDRDLHAILADPTSKALIVVGDRGFIRRSDDSGLQWSTTWNDDDDRLTGADVEDDLTALLFDPTSKNLIAVGNGVLKRSNDGGRSWSALARAPESNAYSAAIVDPATATISVVGDRVLRLKPSATTHPLITGVSYSSNPMSHDVILDFEVDDPDRACKEECIRLSGWSRSFFESKQPPIPLPSPSRDEARPSHWLLSLDPARDLSATAGDLFYVSARLKGPHFSLTYPIDSAAIAVPYLVDRRQIWAIASIGFLVVSLGSMYLLWPLGLFQLSQHYSKIEGATAPIPIVGPFAASLSKLLIFPWLASTPRVLDAWIAHHGAKFEERFSSRSEVKDLDYYPLPLRHLSTRERVSCPSWMTFLPYFAEKRVHLQLIGPGGSGKTTLAIQIVRWANERQLAPYRICPLWVEADESPNKGAWLIDRVRTLSEAPGLTEGFVKALMRRKRILVVVDRLSERDEKTQDLWASGLPEFANAMIVTTRVVMQLDTPATRTIELEALGASGTSSFIEHLLTTPGLPGQLRSLSDRGELLKRLAAAVTLGREEVPITPLLVKLFVTTALSRLSSESAQDWDTLPTSIPQVFFDYLGEVNPRDPASKNFLRMEAMYTSAKAIAIAELGDDFRPKFISVSAAREALGACGLPSAAPDPIERLVDNQVLKRIERTGTYYVRFELDPVAEYVAAVTHAERCGGNGLSWNQLLGQIQTHGEAAKNFEAALKITHNTYWEERGWPGKIFG